MTSSREPKCCAETGGADTRRRVITKERDHIVAPVSLPHDPTDTQAEQKANEAKALKADLKREDEAEDVRWLMGSPRGRRMVRRLLDRSGVYQPSFAPNALEMAFKEGHRNYGCWLLTTVSSHCPDLYLLLLKEGKDDSGNRSSSRRRNKPNN